MKPLKQIWVRFAGLAAGEGQTAGYKHPPTKAVSRLANNGKKDTAAETFIVKARQSVELYGKNTIYSSSKENESGGRKTEIAKVLSRNRAWENRQKLFQFLSSEPLNTHDKRKIVLQGVSS